MSKDYTFSLNLKVTDEQELWRSARARCLEDGLSETVLLEVIGTEEEPDVHGCLISLLDPGTGPGGTSISDSWVN